MQLRMSVTRPIDVLLRALPACLSCISLILTALSAFVSKGKNLGVVAIHRSSCCCSHVRLVERCARKVHVYPLSFIGYILL